MLSSNQPIYWFNFYSNESPSVRYRATYFLDYVNKKSRREVCHFIPERSLYSFFRLVRLLIVVFSKKERSIVVIQRVSSFGMYAFLLKSTLRLCRRKHHFVYDLDDAIYMEMDDDSQIRWFMSRVHTVQVGSQELMKYALQFNSNVYLHTTPVIATDLCQVTTVTLPLVIGFIGCYWGTHFDNMKELVFESLLQVNFPIQLEIIGATKEKERELTDLFFKGSTVEVVFKEISNWMNESEINEAMRHWQLGLAPLNDSIVCRAKSAFKVKQYLNLGIPPVSTRVGENPRFIQNFENGFLYDTTDQLTNVLLEFQSMSFDVRHQMKEKAKHASREVYLEKIADDWLTFLEAQQQ